MWKRIKRAYAKVMTINRVWIISCAAFTAAVVSGLYCQLYCTVGFAIVLLLLLASTRYL